MAISDEFRGAALPPLKPCRARKGPSSLAPRPLLITTGSATCYVTESSKEGRTPRKWKLPRDHVPVFGYPGGRGGVQKVKLTRGC